MILILTVNTGLSFPVFASCSLPLPSSSSAHCPPSQHSPIFLFLFCTRQLREFVTPLQFVIILCNQKSSLCSVVSPCYGHIHPHRNTMLHSSVFLFSYPDPMSHLHPKHDHHTGPNFDLESNTNPDPNPDPDPLQIFSFLILIHSHKSLSLILFDPNPFDYLCILLISVWVRSC